jgi:hypothetical protein
MRLATALGPVVDAIKGGQQLKFHVLADGSWITFAASWSAFKEA